METLEFFDYIYGDVEGYISIATRDDFNADSDKLEITSEKWYLWPRDRDRISRYVRVRDDEDVYNSVALFSNKHRTKMDTDARSKVIYVDADTCAPEMFRLPPSISVQTSEGKWHCYWILDTVVSAREASRVSRRLCVAHADQGCDRGFQVSKLLRVPNTANTKYDSNFKVTAEPSGVIYTLAEIEDAYSDISDEAQYTSNGAVPEHYSGMDLSELESRLDAAGLSSLYLEPVQDGVQSWSERAYKLELELFRIGMDITEVFSVMRNAACNKYNPRYFGRLTQSGERIPSRSNPDAVLWEEVQKAYAEFVESDTVITEPTPQGVGVAVRRQFITEPERQKVLDNPTWVQEYVDWVASRSDSPEVYQRTLAYVILSSCLGGRGHIATPYGTFGLNLWMLGVGESTLDRKTTAMNTAMSVINGFAREMAMEVSIDVGSDFTREGAIAELSRPERDKMPALIHIDEVNGFFNEVFQKSYRAGTLETLTALYGGEIPKSMRAGKDSGNPHEGTTCLSFMGFGIESKVASLLTTEHFESGFLARMLWAVADDIKRKKNSNAMIFLDEATTKKKFDRELLTMVQKLQAVARKFQIKTGKIIAFSPEANQRLNKWIEEVSTILDSHEQKSLISASAVRMFTSAAKACALLAMYDKRDTVHEIDVLHVLAQCELWFRDLERMARNISNSDYEKRLEEVVNHVMAHKDHTMLESTLRKKFARYRSSEMDDILNSLKKQGRLRRSTTMAGGLMAIDD